MVMMQIQVHRSYHHGRLSPKLILKVFNPGDNILFRRGDTWSEILTPQGSGNASSPIIYDAYGSGNLPIIDGGTDT